MYHYLTTNEHTKKQELVQCSSPSVAIARAAGDTITAERVDGKVLELLKKDMPVHTLGKAKEAQPASAGDAAGDGEATE